MKRICAEYEEKYVIMALVLEAIEIEMSKQYGQNKFIFETGIRKKDLVSLIQNHSQLKYFKGISSARIISVIEGMEDLSLITHNVLFSQDSPFYLTEEGREAYKKQTYHIIASNLLEAREARRLSKLAIVIAIISIFIAVIIGFLPLLWRNGIYCT